MTPTMRSRMRGALVAGALVLAWASEALAGYGTFEPLRITGKSGPHDFQVEVIDSFFTMEGSGGPPARAMSAPWSFAEPLEGPRFPAPRLGEHSREILAQLQTLSEGAKRRGIGMAFG